MNVAKIEHRIASETLGDSDAEWTQRFVDGLTAALTAEYPGAEIDVNLDCDFCNASQTFVDCDGDDADVKARVGELSNYVWENL